jgi:kynureninase
MAAGRAGALLSSYVRDELVRALEPRLTSWFAHRRQFDFDVTGFEYREDARRFEMGTPALPTIHTALGGQEIVDEVDRCVTALAAYEE